MDVARVVKEVNEPVQLETVVLNLSSTAEKKTTKKQRKKSGTER